MKLTKISVGNDPWLVGDDVAFPWKEVVYVERSVSDEWTMIYVCSGHRTDVVEDVRDVLKLKF